MTLETFFYQGGYAFFVWGAYGMAVLVLGAEILLLRRRRKISLATVKRLMRMHNSNQEINDESAD